jgi:hypothetical protein
MWPLRWMKPYQYHTSRLNDYIYVISLDSRYPGDRDGEIVHFLWIDIENLKLDVT